MLDKDLFRLLDDKKDIVKVIMVSVLGLLTNIGITACICWVIGLAYAGKELNGYILPAVLLAVGIALRLCFSVLGGRIKASLGSKVKNNLGKRYMTRRLSWV